VGRLGRGTAVVLTAAAAEARAEPETHERLVFACAERTLNWLWVL
jgi:hypothetical protein